MSRIDDIKQYIKRIVPLANFTLTEFPKRNSQELEVRISGNILMIEETADGSYGVSVIDAHDDVSEFLFTSYPDTVFKSYESMKEHIIEILKRWNFEMVDNRNVL